MTSETLQDMQGLKAAGAVVGHTIAEMKKSVVPGMTAAELDEVGAKILNHFGAKSAPKVTYNFPERPVLV